ncbi:hypothetical protein DVH24_017644 [Malus domestica]|uniref:DUF7865 domain-containing protein n=1 Tax=Malus domestica TaxID=3750 RepID=A0A498KJ47_MALDO|nr:hypothetical protein DVH24_017644 [Malus domestica]
MFYMTEVYTFGHRIETAQKLLGSTPYDLLLIRIGDSFSGLLLRPPSLRDRLPAAHGLLRERSQVPKLLRQGVHVAPRFHGDVAVLLQATGGGPRLGLAEADGR